MKLFLASVMSLSLLASASDSSPAITITRHGSQPSRQGAAETFTGTVRIDPLFNANPPSRTSGGRVTFEPGARSAWHTHPLGQTLIVTAGAGWIQQWGGPIQEIREGDVVWIPPGQKHWARSHAHDTHDTYRHHGISRKQERRVDGTGQRSAIPQVTPEGQTRTAK